MTDETIPQAPVAEAESSLLIVPNGPEMVRVAGLGLVVGLLIPLIAWMLQRFFISPIFCHGASTLGVCSGSDLTAYYVGTVVATVIAVALLANWQIFRPLLVAVAAAAALWGMRKYMGDIVQSSGWEYYLASAILYAVAYLLFYWVMRLRNFALSVILAVAVVIVVRWAFLA